MTNKKDILKPHDYDGIQEYDNSLPLWWVGTFVITVVFGFCYWLYYQVYQTGPNQEQEYHLAMTAHEQNVNRNSDEVDPNEILALSHNSAALLEAKTLFLSNCMACHGANAQGVIGPNLTDNYWIHGGSLKDIFVTIRDGYPDKAMPTWSGLLSPQQIEQLSSFVKSLKGTSPASPKEKQGELFNETDATSVVETTIDSTVTAIN